MRSRAERVVSRCEGFGMAGLGKRGGRQRTPVEEATGVAVYQQGKIAGRRRGILRGCVSEGLALQCRLNFLSSLGVDSE
jgi:hypothetical protein